jgi:DNA-directed RNA polymerase subunit RPC12/RpoP
MKEALEMSDLLKVKCRKCGVANKLKMGRVYTNFRCEQCGSEIDLDATLTFELVPEQRPVKLMRDTVTVGFRPRKTDDKARCHSCGEPAELDWEDVLGADKNYRCAKCGGKFHPDE